MLEAEDRKHWTEKGAHNGESPLGRPDPGADPGLPPESGVPDGLLPAGDLCHLRGLLPGRGELPPDRADDHSQRLLHGRLPLHEIHCYAIKPPAGEKEDEKRSSEDPIDP